MSARSLARVLGLALLVACVAGPARAGARADARRHFKAGMRLIGKGSYESGIRELEAAYRIKPHPNVLFNIAKAWQDAGELDAALHTWRRYQSLAPDDGGAVARTIAELEQKLAAKAAPPPAPVAPPSPAPADAASAETLERLAAAAERLEKAIARAESLGKADGPAPPVAPPSGSREDLLLGGLSATEEVGVYEEVVVSASRRAQLSIEAPASTTVITADEIRASGATSIPDLLRRVPGADVMTMGVSEADVSMRGFNNRISNKVLILVDGRSVYQDFVGATFWSVINVPLEEIERIEVVRGPGSALYGANAALGVVNIITKRPGELRGSRVVARGGMGNTLEGTYTFGGAEGDLGYRAHVGYLRSDKYSRDFDRDRPDYVPHYGDPAADDLSTESKRFNADFRWGLGRRDAVTVGAGYLEGQAELYPIGALRNFYLDGTVAHVRGELALAPVKLKLYWNRTDLASGPQYWPAGVRPIDTTVLQDVVDAELQGDFSFDAAGDHHLAVGAGWRLKDIEMDWLAGGGEREIHLSAFLQDEWAPLEKLRLVASARADKHPLLPQPVVSPRGAVIVLPVPEHAIRVSYGTAFRVPSFIESYTAVDPPVASVAGVSTQFRGDPALEPEYVTSAELGWRGSFVERVDVDVAAYRLTVEDLIVQSGLTAPGFDGRRDPATGQFILGTSKFENAPDRYVAYGGETGLRVTPVDRLDLRLAYAHEEIFDEAGEDATLQTPRDKVAVGGTFRHAVGVTVNADAAYVSETEWVERVFDPAAPGGIRLDRYPLESYVRLDARIGYRFWRDRIEVAALGTNLLGTAYREHPFGNDIATRVLGSRSASF